MPCLHATVKMAGAAIVDRAGQGRRMRAYCQECREFVECEPVIVRGCVQVATGWVTADYVIPEIGPDLELEPRAGEK